MTEPRGPPLGVYVGEALARYGFGEGYPFGPDRQRVRRDEARRPKPTPPADRGGSPGRSATADSSAFGGGGYGLRNETAARNGVVDALTP